MMVRKLKEIGQKCYDSARSISARTYLLVLTRYPLPALAPLVQIDVLKT